MSPHYVAVHPDDTVRKALSRVREHAAEAETIYTVLVTGTGRKLEGVVSLRDLVIADDNALVGEVMSAATLVEASVDEEEAARLLLDRDYLLLPVVDSERRLVGILTFDDAVEIQKREEDEDAARAGGAEPLRRPYLSSGVLRIARSRILWLLILGVSALFTVQVLGIFEATLEQALVLSLFIPLLTGMGGNTGSQAASTLTRALAVGDVEPRDIARVMARELGVGFTLGLTMGIIGFLLAWGFFGIDIGLVIGLTIVAICTISATIGGAMPLIGKSVKVDPAVFSTPFITTLSDATGLVVYFSIAKLILGI